MLSLIRQANNDRTVLMLERVAPLALEVWLDYNVLGTRISGAVLRLARPSLDLADMRDASEIAAKMRTAVPIVDRRDL